MATIIDLPIKLNLYVIFVERQSCSKQLSSGQANAGVQHFNLKMDAISSVVDATIDVKKWLGQSLTACYSHARD